MTRQELQDLFNKVVDEAANVMRRKGADYATEDDALWNIKRAGAYGVAVRLDDKVGRLLNLLRTGKLPSNESVHETVVDIVNYAVLLEAAMVPTTQVAGATSFGTSQEVLIKTPSGYALVNKKLDEHQEMS